MNFVSFSLHKGIILSASLRPGLNDRMVALCEYYLIRRDKIGKGSGGVAMYIADFFQTKIVHQSEDRYSNKPEYLMTEVSVHNIKVLIAVIY